jgi:MFS family permease
METLILGWYVLVESKSVLLFTVFASLQYIGTLIAPMFGVVGDRIGHRNLLCAMRAAYATLAALLTLLIFAGALTPLYVLAIAAVAGLVRPSDLGIRGALVGETIPAAQLMGALSIQRTTQDSARVAGALTGAGLVTTLGMGPAYLGVVSLYAISVLLTLKAGSAHSALQLPKGAVDPARASPWQELKEGLAYVWATPHLRALICFAFALNMTAFPLLYGLLPYVAKEIYHANQTTLGYMVAGAAFGALLGSIALSRWGGALRPARMMLVACAAWYALLLVFVQVQSIAGGILMLLLAGCAQSAGVIPMAMILLRNSDEKFRGRIMGMRMLALYGNLPGLLIFGPLVAFCGYAITASLYCVFGLACALFVAVRWRAQLWRLAAPANKR